MKKIFLFASFATALLFSNYSRAQQVRVGVFDIDIMVQAMPGYRAVDSIVQVYERDSLATEYNIYQSEYMRLDSTFKADSALVAAGKKSKQMLDYTANERKKMGLNLVYWNQIAQNKSNNKRSQASQKLYEDVVNAYKKVLARKNYTIVLKPQTYEFGFRIENIFISVAKELKLTELPQQLLTLGDDPDAKPAAAPAGAKPKSK